MVKKILFWFLGLLLCSSSYAQLCGGGRRGVPVVLETFGAGTGFGPALPASVTNYTYNGTGLPPDGSYTIFNSSAPDNSQAGNWHNGRDHTGDLNGRMMVVNASYAPGEFFKKDVTGLCPNTTYTFSAWLANVNTPAVETGACAGQYVWPKVKFEVVNPDASKAGVETGNIPALPTLTWVEYGFTYTTKPGQTTLTVVMTNTGPGGCGNDIVIDDITFRSCGPTLDIAANPAKPSYCVGENLTLNGTIGGVYSNPVYQWQISTDNNVTWTNLAGKNSINLPLSPLALVNKGNYRLIAAENGNLGSITCGIISDTLSINVVPLPVFTVNSVPVCAGTSATLTATLNAASAATTYTWDNGGGNGNPISVTPGATTTYTATGTDVNGCKNTATGTVTVKPMPTASAAGISICEGKSGILTATGNAAAFSWSPATGLSATTGTTVTANPAATSTYTVTGTTNGCSTSSNVTVAVKNKPTIAASNVEFCKGGSVTVTATGNSASIVWSPATGLSGTTGNSVTANPANTTIYKVKGTTAGCSDSVNVTVTVNPNPKIGMVVQNPTICAGGTTPLTASSNASPTTYTWTPNDGSLNALAGQAVSASPSVTTLYTVIGKDSKGCIGQDTGRVTVTTPTLVLLPHAAICEGDTAHLVASGMKDYIWSPNDGSLSALTGAKVIAKPTTTTTYTVMGSTPGCSSNPQKSITLTVNPTPTVTITPSPASICNGQTSSLTASGALTYQWKADATLDGTTGAVRVAGPTSGHTYSVQGTDSKGCKDSATVSIIVNQPPSFTVNSPSICIGKSATLTTNLSVTSAATTFAWDNGAGTGASITVSPNATTTYTATGTDVNGCKSTASGKVTINKLPILVKPADVPICFGDSTSLTTGAALGKGLTYLWTPSTGLNKNNDSTVIAKPTATKQYTITGTDNNGCINTTNVTVTVNTLPTVTITALPASICVGESSTLTASGASTYQWKTDATLNGTTGAVRTASPLASKLYHVQGTDNNGCKDSASASVNVNPLPVFTVNNPSICNGGSANLKATLVSPDATTTFTWNKGAGTGDSVVVSPVITTEYIAQATDGNGCKYSGKGTVTIKPLPILNKPPDTPICIGESLKLTTGEQSGMTLNYTWSPADGLDKTNSKTVTATPDTTTQYTITGTDDGGCTNTTSVMVIVNPLPEVKTSSVQTCKGTAATLTSSSITATKYSWTPAAGLDNDSSQTVKANPSQTQLYIVTAIDANGCKDTAHATVIVNPLPDPFVATPPQICLGDVVPLIVVNKRGVPTTFLWSDPTSDLNRTNDDTVIAKPKSNSNLYTVKATDLNGCEASYTVKVLAETKLIPEISDSIAMCKGEIATLEAGGGKKYLWSNGLTDNVISVSPAKTTIYRVTIKNDFCEDTISVRVRIKDEIDPILFIPNTFTPNDDDVNDIFKAYSNSLITKFEGFIFNRWGELVYEWQNVKGGWDGKLNNEVVKNDVYVYKIRAKSECQAIFGKFEIGTVSLAK